MESVETSGRTVDEAVQKALQLLGLRREQVEVTVLREGGRGLLGLGTDMARVLVTPQPETKGNGATEDDAGRIAVATLERLLKLMEIPAQVTLKQSGLDGNVPTVALEVTGEYLGVLIGRRGETMAALQYILGLMVNRQLRKWTRVTVDVEGYRERRERMIRDMAYRAADRARRFRQPVVMDPMPPAERRIIHLALQDHPDVTTQSIGEGDNRRVVISPRR